MEHLLETFFDIDKTCKKIITKEDLNKYAEENEYDETMPDTWMTLFDPDKTGHITLEAFCNKLGLPIDCDRIREWEQSNTTVKAEHVAPVEASVPISQTSTDKNQLPSEVSVVFSQMAEPMKANIYRIAEGILQSGPDVKPLTSEEATQKLKSKLDEEYGMFWTVAIISGSYWITHTHQQERTFHFRMGDRTIVVWQNASARKVAQHA